MRLASKVELAGYGGTGDPVLSTTEIGFNGKGEDDSHETFLIKRGQDGFQFCKTAQKPYDIVVCAALIILRHRIRTFRVSSDGGPDDWADAIKLCQDVLGYGVYPCHSNLQEEEPVTYPEFKFKRMVPEGLKEKKP